MKILINEEKLKNALYKYKSDQLSIDNSSKEEGERAERIGFYKMHTEDKINEKV